MIKQKEQENLLTTLLQLVFNMVPVFIVVTDSKDNTVLEVNETFLKNTGNSRTNVIGKPLEEAGFRFYSGEKEQAQEVFTRRSGMFSKNHIHMLISDCIYQVEIQGRLLEVHCISDVTAQMRAQKDLEENHERYVGVVSKSNDVYYTVDFNGNFIYISAACKRLTGYEPSDLAGKSYMLLIDNDYKKYVHDFYYRQFKERTKETLNEFPIQTRKGIVVWVHQYVRLIEKDDIVYGFECIVKDISDLKNLGEHFRRSLDRLEEKVPGSKKFRPMTGKNILKVLPEYLKFLTEELQKTA